METRKVLAAALIAALATLLVPRSAAASDAPDYSSDAMSNLPSQWGFGTPEEDGRPGQYYFIKAVDATKHRDYRFAIDMYQASASWAYKPAQYNLAILYLQGGDGVAVDKPRAMSWAALAAERDEAEYIDRTHEGQAGRVQPGWPAAQGYDDDLAPRQCRDFEAVDDPADGYKP